MVRQRARSDRRRNDPRHWPLGGLLRALRILLDFPLHDVAPAGDTTPSTISRLEGWAFAAGPSTVALLQVYGRALANINPDVIIKRQAMYSAVAAAGEIAASSSRRGAA
jgi:hypothetical protein